MLKFLLPRTIVFMALIAAAGAQAQIPPELLQKFQSLPPEQQQALMGQAQQSGLLPAGQPASSTMGSPVSPTIQDVAAPEPGVTPASGQVGSASQTTPAAANAAPVTAPAASDEGSTLKPFGYDLFNATPTTFAPAIDIPIPKDYLLGPGDVIEVQLFGKTNSNYSLTVQRDGSVQFPDLGPIQVNGMQFDTMRQMLQDQISKRMIGVQAAITMGPLRSIRVFLLGDARRPGSYDVSSLSTMTNALFVGGGIAETGSLRRIQLKRQGRVVTTLDLYDLLLRGDTSRDARLEPGDVIFIPAVGMTAGVSGNVRRPAIYEFTGTTSAAELASMAGGLLPTAYPAAARIQRIDENGAKTVADIDLSGQGGKTGLRNGDLLTVPGVLERVESAVFVRGHVERPGALRWREGMTVSDALRGPENMKAIPDLDFGLIARESPIDRTITVLAFSPREVFAQRHGAEDLVLRSRDTLYVFGLSTTRSEEFSELLETLRLQARKTDIEEIVTVKGDVQAAGPYPRFEGMRVSDLLKASLNLGADADRDYSLLIRENRARHEISVLTVNLNAVRAGDAAANFALEPRDQLLVFNARAARDELLAPYLERLKAQARLNEPAKVVKVTGEVRFPGMYPMSGSMTANDLIGVAGGLSEPAYALTAEVSRATADQNSGYSVEPLTVDLASSASPFALQADDTLQIRRLPNFTRPEVVVLEGEFRFPGEYRIKDGETLRQLIQRAGGLTVDADANNTLFTRDSLKEAEGEQLRLQRQQLQRDIARMQLEVSSDAASDGKAAPAQAVAFTQELVSKLADVQPVGRMVVELPKVMAGDKDYDLRLLGGDTLRVGKHPQAVSVFGEVLFPTSHQYQSGKSVSSYVRSSGGFTQDADSGRTYLVRANGEIIGSAKGWSWDASVKPGDTIIVPLDTHPIDPMKLTSNIAQILSSLAITAAAMNAVGAF